MDTGLEKEALILNGYLLLLYLIVNDLSKLQMVSSVITEIIKTVHWAMTISQRLEKQLLNN